MSYQFSSDESISDAFHRTSRELLAEAERTLTEDAAANETRAVHSARKAVKKQRALLRLMRHASAPKQRRRENAALRAAARRLSGARDQAVTIAALDDLAERYAGQVPHPVFDTLRDRLRSHQPVFSDLSPGGPHATAAAELAAVRERLDEWTLRRGDIRALAGGLDRSYRAGRDAMRAARRKPTDGNLHAWRKRAKDMWYELRLLKGVCGEMAAGQAREAHRLADLLGDDHDLAVLRGTLQRVAGDAPTDVEAVLALIDHRRAELQAEAFVAGGRVYAEPPQAFVKRMRRQWRAGYEQAHARASARPAALAAVTRTPAAA